MKEHWNKRFGQKEFAYGTEPNVIFKACLEKYKLTGNILFANEGEGRNAVFAAKNGLNASAFDMSEEGKKKALGLAKENNVEINYLLGEFSECEFELKSFETIVLIFAHYPSSVRKDYHQKLTTYLKKNGLIIVIGFSKEQLKFSDENPSAGGPKSLDLLYSISDLEDDFVGLEILESHKNIVTLDEGDFHQGESSVITFIARK